MLQCIPTESDLARIYYELSEIGARCVGKKAKWPYSKVNKINLIILAVEMSRYDPRLFDILVEYFVNNWRHINPVKLRELYSSMQTPQVFGVISEFLKSACEDKEVIPYSDYLVSGLKPVSVQFFFHGLYKIGGTLAKRAMEFSLVEYKRWGFLATERPSISGAKDKTIGTLDKVSRINMLRNLLKKKEIITISDYLKLLEHSISRQQALIDLNDCDFIEKFGRGRGSKWRLAA